jgi:hypothetical protein
VRIAQQLQAPSGFARSFQKKPIRTQAGCEFMSQN